MSKSHTGTTGPFRQKPWPLSSIRLSVHKLRLLRIRLSGRFRFTHGAHVAVAKGADVRPPHYFELGHYVSIGKDFTCETDLRVGSHVLISSNVSIVGKDHPFDDPTQTVFSHPRVDNSPVTIGSDVLIGFGTIIVGAVTIGDGCIVGAGSVVARDLPPYTICVGAPARAIKPRYPDKTVPANSNPA